MTKTQHRKEQAARFAAQLGLNPEQLYAATDAVWSNLNPQTVSFDHALSVAAVALRAARDVDPR
jgi:hypothetical protein